MKPGYFESNRRAWRDLTPEQRLDLVVHFVEQGRPLLYVSSLLAVPVERVRAWYETGQPIIDTLDSTPASRLGW